jgi:hypothetical protein
MAYCISIVHNIMWHFHNKTSSTSYVATLLSKLPLDMMFRLNALATFVLVEDVWNLRI